MWQWEKTTKWMRREQNVTKTRNSKDLDTRNQQLDTMMQRKFNKTKTKRLGEKAKNVFGRG